MGLGKREQAHTKATWQLCKLLTLCLESRCFSRDHAHHNSHDVDRGAHEHADHLAPRRSADHATRLLERHECRHAAPQQWGEHYAADPAGVAPATARTVFTIPRARTRATKTYHTGVIEGLWADVHVQILRTAIFIELVVCWRKALQGIEREWVSERSTRAYSARQLTAVLPSIGDVMYVPHEQRKGLQRMGPGTCPSSSPFDGACQRTDHCRYQASFRVN